MKKRLRLSLFLLIAAVLLSSCGKVSLSGNTNRVFEDYTLDLFRQEVSSDTLDLHFTLQNPASYGVQVPSPSWGTFLPDNTRTMTHLQTMEKELKTFSYQSLSAKNRLTYDILSYHCKSSMDALDYPFYKEPLSPLTGIHAQLPMLLSEYRLENEEDIKEYLALLELLPDYFSSLLAFEQEKAAKGLFMCDKLAADVITECNTFTGMGENNPLITSFAERLSALPKLSDKKRKHFLKTNSTLMETRVIPAYERLSSGLSELMGSCPNPRSLSALPKGKNYYALLVAAETGSARSISELKTLIQKQILSDLLEMQSIVAQNPELLNGSLGAPAELSLDAFGDLSPEEILSGLKQKILPAFPKPAAVKEQVKYVPKALEPYLSPAFYLIPCIDNYKENTIYINGGCQPDALTLFTTLAHEGYPGHLYQTTYFAATKPDPIRSLLSFPGYTEGWATYVEMCSYSISGLPKSAAALLQRNASLLLGLYAYADMGIHYDGWTLAETSDFFSSYGIENEAAMEEIYYLILGDPANYLKYYVGYVEILELKKGSNLTQKDFHRKLLEIGPAPFEIIKKYL